MAETRVDLAKVTQMLDAGWKVMLFRGAFDPYEVYEVRAIHSSPERMEATRRMLVETMSKNTEFLEDTSMTASEAVEETDFHGSQLMTSDFTPEAALTRMAYKVFGEVI